MPCKPCKTVKACKSKNPHFCSKSLNKCCCKPDRKSCKPCKSLPKCGGGYSCSRCSSVYPTANSERVNLRRQSNSCCPPAKCFETCKPKTCPTSKKVKIPCYPKDRLIKIDCGKCAPCETVG